MQKVKGAVTFHTARSSCGTKMRLIHSLSRPEIMPAMQVFRCDAWGETLIWKSSLGKRPADTELSNRAVTPYVALSFTQADGDGFAPGQAV
jgi:hypothetical protein